MFFCLFEAYPLIDFAGTWRRQHRSVLVAYRLSRLVWVDVLLHREEGVQTCIKDLVRQGIEFRHIVAACLDKGMG